MMQVQVHNGSECTSLSKCSEIVLRFSLRVLRAEKSLSMQVATTAQKGLVYNGFPFLYTCVCNIVYSLVDELI